MTRRNTPSREERKSSFEIRSDKYRNLTIEITNEQNDYSKAGNDSENKSTTSPEIKALMNRLFFAHFIMKKCDRTKKLSLHGNEVFLRRGKRLGDDDVPNLLTFLRVNPGIVDLDLAHNEIQCDGFIDIIKYVTVIVENSEKKVVKFSLQSIGAFGNSIFTVKPDVFLTGFNYIYGPKPSKCRLWCFRHAGVLSSNCMNFLTILQTHEEIVELDLRNNEIRSRGIDNLCEFADRLKLKALKLNGNKFGVESSKRIALMLLNNRSLRELNVASVDQTASSLVYFINALRNNQDLYNDTLKILNISSPNPGCMYNFDSAHVGSLIGTMLKNNNCLERLNLRNFGFSCYDIELMLAEGRYNETLLFLDLTANNIGDFGAEIIAEWLAKRPALRGLEMARNIVTSNGAISLGNGLPFSRIKYFDISCNRIDDSGITDILNTIKKSPRLRSLKIFGNCIGHDSAKIINRMLLSGVLVQENLDVKPYKIGEEWKCARYLADNLGNQ